MSANDVAELLAEEQSELHRGAQQLRQEHTEILHVRDELQERGRQRNIKKKSNV